MGFTFFFCTVVCFLLLLPDLLLFAEALLFALVPVLVLPDFFFAAVEADLAPVVFPPRFEVPVRVPVAFLVFFVAIVKKLLSPSIPIPNYNIALRINAKTPTPQQ